jgi:hypothetical protein
LRISCLTSSSVIFSPSNHLWDNISYRPSLSSGSFLEVFSKRSLNSYEQGIPLKMFQKCFLS